MATTIVNNQKITSADASEVEVQFNAVAQATFPQPFQEVTIEADSANSGTIQFSVGEAIVAGHDTLAAGEKIILTIRNGYQNLRYKASGAGQIFTVRV